MATLHARIDPPDTELEHVRRELDRFNSVVGPQVLKELTRMLRDREGASTFALRVQIHGTAGRITKVQILPDYTITLDGDDRA